MNIHGDYIKHHQRLRQLLEFCTKLRSVNTTKPLHALTITLGPNPTEPVFYNNNVISLYASTNHLSTARKLFDKMPQRNQVSYNTIINSYSKSGLLHDAWSCFYEMMGCGFRPNNFTLSGLLSCSSMKVSDGVLLQGLAVKCGLLCCDAFVGTALLGLFGRCGYLEEAFWVFDYMTNKTLVTWNSMMYLFGQYGFVEDCLWSFREIVRKDCCLSDGSFVGVMSGLGNKEDLSFGEAIHCLAIKTSFDYEVSVSNSIVSMYTKCGGKFGVEKLFEKVGVRDVVTWNTVIGAMAKSGQPNEAVELFLKMIEGGIRPDHGTYVCVIDACTCSRVNIFGEAVHAKVTRIGFYCDVYVGNALVDYYCKCCKLDDAHRCFKDIQEKTVVSWNILILGYANCSLVSIKLLVDMLRLGYWPNEYSFSAALKYVWVPELKQLHCLIIKMGYETNEYVLSSLITCYGKNDLVSYAMTFLSASEETRSTVAANNIAGIYNRSGQHRETLEWLSQVEEPDTVSWNIVIAACAHNGSYKEVFELFKNMQVAQIHPDNYTFVSLVSSCAKLGDISLGNCIHGLLMKTNFYICDILLCNVLVDMYGKCGSHESSFKVFNGMEDKNAITWTALISAFGVNGCSLTALSTFEEMTRLGNVPDKVTFLAVLTACRHGALVEPAIRLFDQMKSYGINPELDHYHCLVDLLAKCGHLDEAESIISNMPFPPNAPIWRSFLKGCKRYGVSEYKSDVQ